ncbi:MULTISPECIES: 16S rRNA (guanine(527)-N(7))-methyltransferase RsmG [unclassified Agromyces]|uniref:16S rRNA (guanine(527)-N(7))-methyltransferase RsmG n=1 Tax=unclassified Agromyces TaxID=2639701 RepID=UPI003014FAB6
MTDHSPAGPHALEAEPASARVVFGDRLGLVRRFTENLARHGEELGLIGPLELPRLWSRHVVNSGLVAPLLRPGRVGDVGSGAGLPGLVLAIARPDVHLTLIEPMERRVAWLNRQVDELDLQNVDVVRARAEEAKLTGQLDQVTARAVSALRTLIPITAPLLKPGGELLLMKGAGVIGEMGAAEKALRKYRLENVEVTVLGEGVVDDVTRVFRARVPQG